MTDQEPIAAAILAALNTGLAPAAAGAYDLDGVPGSFGNPGNVPAASVVIRLYLRPSTTRRYDGDWSLSEFFLDTTYRARNVQSCRELKRLVHATLQARIVGGYGFSFNDETGPIDDDPDWGYSGTDTWSFA